MKEVVISEDKVMEEDKLSIGPPSSNLRKGNSKSIPNDLNMATNMGDKATSQQQQLRQSARKHLNRSKKKSGNSVSTPSVKEWLYSGESGEETSQHTEGQWQSPNRGQGQRGVFEDWATDRVTEDGNSTSSRNQTDSSECESEGEDEDGIHDPENEAQRREDASKNTIQDANIDDLTQEEMKELLKEVLIVVKNMEKIMLDKEAKDKKFDIRLSQLKDKVRLVTGTTTKHDREIGNNAKKINQFELRSMKNNILIQGIKEQKDEDCAKKTDAFFEKVLKVPRKIAFDVAHRIGRREDAERNRTMVVKLKKAGDKGIIYKHSKNLKDITNGDGEKYYINDQLPELQEEAKRKKKLKVKINKTLIDAQQQNIEWKRGELLVDGAPYKEKIAEPTNTEILEMPQQSLSKILKMKLYKGDEFNKNGSTFIAYAAKVHSIQQVADGYKQMRYRFINATHLICCYRIMDPDVVHMTDCVDGGELGAGRRLIQMMMDESFENVAVYVIRYHRGPNIGAVRFEMIKDAAKAAISNIPATLGAMIQEPVARNLSLHRSTDASEFMLNDGTITVKKRNGNGARIRGGSHVVRSLPFSSKSPARPGSFGLLPQTTSMIDI